MEAKVIITTELQLKAIVADAISVALKHLQSPAPSVIQTDIPPIISSEQVKAMTGWPDGTFYQKVHQMPEGVVIRGKSKRLLFDRAKFISWLTASDSTAEVLQSGPVKKRKQSVA